MATPLRAVVTRMKYVQDDVVVEWRVLLTAADGGYQSDAEEEGCRLLHVKAVHCWCVEERRMDGECT